MSVEDAAEHDAHELHARLVVPAQAKGRQGQVDRPAEAGIVGVADALLRDLGVDQQRDAKLGRAGEGGLEDRIIEVLVADPAVENGALAAQILDRPLELARGGVAVPDGQHRQRLKARRVGGHGLGQEVVDAARQVDAMVAEIVQARRRQRQDLHVDAGLVHQGQPLLAEVGQAFVDDGRIEGQGAVIGAGEGRPGALHVSRKDMFFDADDLHG
jgi:hypothetical protein